MEDIHSSTVFYDYLLSNKGTTTSLDMYKEFGWKHSQTMRNARELRLLGIKVVSLRINDTNYRFMII